MMLSGRALRRSLLLALTGLLASPTVHSDPVMITRAMTATSIAEIFVERDSVLVELEIGVADLPAFRNLLPTELLERLEGPAEPMGDRLERFFRDDLPIVAGGGRRLRGRLLRMSVRTRIQRDEVTGAPLPNQDPNAERVLVATLSYAVGSLPDTLAFSPPGGGPRASGPIANIGFVVYHEGLPVNDFRYLAPSTTLVLDWDDPWYSQFTRRAFRRQFYAPLSAYLYVEPHEVRKEIVLRPRDLQRWTDLGIEGKDSLTVAEQEEVLRKVVAFLDTRNPVHIDGQAVTGRLDRAHFIYRTLRTTGVIDPPRDLRLTEALLGVIVYYPVDSLPQEVSMDWELFADGIQVIPSAATDEAGSLPYLLTPDDHILTWHNVLTNPTWGAMVEELAVTQRWRLPFFVIMAIGVALVAWLIAARWGGRGRQSTGTRAALGTAAALLIVAGGWGAFRTATDSDDGAPILGALLTNMYRAFDYRDDERIYDTLARSATGGLLTDVYLEMRRSLELANQGGARAKVTDVEILEADFRPLGGGGFATHATWNVSGSVGHWGHTHVRTNQYEARFDIHPIDGVWKISSMTVLQEERL
jgi:hypothetical protein